MTNATSLIYWNERVQLSQPRSLTLLYQITAAKTVADPLRSPALTAFDAVASQAVIDSFLGTTSEFAVAAFDATAMGTDAFAVIVKMDGQAAELFSARVRVSTGTGGVTLTGTTIVQPVAALTVSSLTNQAARGATGNLAVRTVISGLDALTSGLIEVVLLWRSK